MPKRILWLSRHLPLPRQLAELEHHFPGYDLAIDGNSFDGADDIISRYRRVAADELVVVAPLAVIRALTMRGVRPIFAEMRQVRCRGRDGQPNKEVEVRMGRRRPRCYRFERFHHVNGVDLKLEPLAPTGDQPKEESHGS